MYHEKDRGVGVTNSTDATSNLMRWDVIKKHRRVIKTSRNLDPMVLACFVDAARRRGFLVTAIHNHWLFEKPRLMYLHLESVENPVQFAIKPRKALNLLN